MNIEAAQQIPPETLKLIQQLQEVEDITATIKSAEKGFEVLKKRREEVIMGIRDLLQLNEVTGMWDVVDIGYRSVGRTISLEVPRG